MQTISFEQVKETKNKIRFQEQTPPGELEKVGTLYVSKDVIAELGNPESVTVSIEKAE